MNLAIQNISFKAVVPKSKTRVQNKETGKFESENIGQLGTYITAVNHILKKDVDNPTLGLLICKNKDNVLAQYALLFLFQLIYHFLKLSKQQL